MLACGRVHAEPALSAVEGWRPGGRPLAAIINRRGPVRDLDGRRMNSGEGAACREVAPQPADHRRLRWSCCMPRHYLTDAPGRSRGSSGSSRSTARHNLCQYTRACLWKSKRRPNSTPNHFSPGHELQPPSGVLCRRAFPCIMLTLWFTQFSSFKKDGVNAERPSADSTPDRRGAGSNRRDRLHPARRGRHRAEAQARGRDAARPGLPGGARPGVHSPRGRGMGPQERYAPQRVLQPGRLPRLHLRRTGACASTTRAACRSCTISTPASAAGRPSRTWPMRPGCSMRCRTSM